MKKFRKLAVLCAVLALMLCFTTVAYASGGEEIPEPTPTPTATPEPTKAPNPFTPAGTGTVLENATDEDGKEFFTIMTPDENVFYLVIDRQRGQENVYFLNAVTEKDLLALAEKSGDTQSALPTPEPEKTPEATPAPQTAAPTEQAPAPAQNNNMGTLLLVLAVVVIGGGAGYYFKIYRPKKQRAESEDDFDYGGEADPYGAEDAEQADELPPWEDEDNGDGQA